MIYKIYYSNERVKSMCKNEISPNKISKQDTSWLINLEEEVNKPISTSSPKSSLPSTETPTKINSLHNSVTTPNIQSQNDNDNDDLDDDNVDKDITYQFEC